MDKHKTHIKGFGMTGTTLEPFLHGSTAVLGMVLLLLVVATVIIHLKYPTQELKDRIRSWWYIVGFFIVGVMLNTTVAMFFFGILSYLALKEYFTLIPTRRTDRRVLFYAYLSIVPQFWFASIEWYGMFIIWIPVFLFLLLPFRQILIGDTKGFLENTARVQWGLMMFVFGLSHLAYMITLNPVNPNGAGGKELVLYLVLLTELNDILQYLWGKSIGKRKIVPKVSPNKTVEGFVGAFASIMLLALLFSFLTPFVWYEALIAGMIISASGFVGDVVISMVKRDIGVKDSGSMLPGHGGILDRVDSLVYTAPLFFHYIYYLYY